MVREIISNNKDHQQAAVDTQRDYDPHKSHQNYKLPTSNFDVYNPNQSPMYQCNAQTQQNNNGYQRASVNYKYDNSSFFYSNNVTGKNSLPENNQESNLPATNAEVQNSSLFALNNVIKYRSSSDSIMDWYGIGEFDVDMIAQEIGKEIQKEIDENFESRDVKVNYYMTYL